MNKTFEISGHIDIRVKLNRDLYARGNPSDEEIIDLILNQIKINIGTAEILKHELKLTIREIE